MQQSPALCNSPALQEKKGRLSPPSPAFQQPNTNETIRTLNG